jgi:hypothetical protein
MAHKGRKNDDNKKRVMVPGSAKRVTTSGREEEKIDVQEWNQAMIFKTQEAKMAEDQGLLTSFCHFALIFFFVEWGRICEMYTIYG